MWKVYIIRVYFLLRKCTEKMTKGFVEFGL